MLSAVLVNFERLKDERVERDLATGATERLKRQLVCVNYAIDSEIISQVYVGNAKS